MPMELMIEVGRLHPNPRNKNVHTDEDINKLSATIGAYGLINPISVRPLGGEQLQIISGEGRLLAVKKLGWNKVPVRLFEEFDEIMVDGMRLAENKVRVFDFLAECQEFANLHRLGKNIPTLAREFGESATMISEKVGIGYMPSEIIERLREGRPISNGKLTSWRSSYISRLLRLRILKTGCSFDGGFVQKGDTQDYSVYEYSEIRRAVEIFNSDKDLSELKEYIAERRLEIEEEQREQILQSELKAQLVEIQEKQEKKLEELKNEMGREKQGELETALTEARQLREEKAKIEAETPQKLKALRQSLSKVHQEELRRKDESSSNRLTSLQKQLDQTRQERDQAFSKARQELKKEFDRELRKTKALADEQKTEAEKRQTLIDELQLEFNQKVAGREREIEVQFQTQLEESQQAIENLLAEQKRFQVETKSLQEETEFYSAEIANLKKEQEKAISEKDKLIVAKDEEIKRLIVEMDTVREGITEEEVKKRVAEYQTQLGKEYEERKKALEQYYAQREEKLRIKTEKTVDDAIGHFMKVCGEMDASIRNLVYSLLEHMREDQVRDVAIRAEWLYRKLLEVGEVLKDKMDERKETHPSEVTEIALPK